MSKYNAILVTYLFAPYLIDLKAHETSPETGVCNLIYQLIGETGKANAILYNIRIQYLVGKRLDRLANVLKH